MKRILLLAASATMAASARAVVIDTFPDWDGNITNGWLAVAQSFTVPNVDTVLTGYSFATEAGQSSITASVYAWDNTVGPTGSALYSTNVDGSAGGTFTVNPNLALTAGGLYAMVLDLNGNTGSSIHFQVNQNSYSGGDASWWNGTWDYLDSGWNTSFRAEFSPVPEPATLVVLGAGLLALAKRRKR